jgi:tRNA splicing endonuclease
MSGKGKMDPKLISSQPWEKAYVCSVFVNEVTGENLTQSELVEVMTELGNGKKRCTSRRKVYKGLKDRGFRYSRTRLS